jgi:hypothetical protein
MKTKTKKIYSRAIKPKRSEIEPLYFQLRLLLDEDLCDPQVEKEARSILYSMREKGFSIESHDLEDKDCLLCLDLVLHSAFDICSESMDRPPEWYN